MAALRQALIDLVWSGGGLPTRLPSHVIEDVALPSRFAVGQMPNLERTDQLVIPLPQGFEARAYRLHATVTNGRAIVVHQGHSAELGSLDVNSFVREAIAEGYDVALLAMPGRAPNLWPPGPPNYELHPYYANISSYRSLPKILLDQISHFFGHYKDLEPDKWVRVDRWGEAAEALKMIESAIAKNQE